MQDRIDLADAFEQRHSDHDRRERAVSDQAADLLQAPKVQRRLADIQGDTGATAATVPLAKRRRQTQG
jgi:hypothetical protein